MRGGEKRLGTAHSSGRTPDQQPALDEVGTQWEVVRQIVLDDLSALPPAESPP